MIVSADPATKTIIHENSSTTIVRNAVATSESVFLIPHFARIAVTPAKSADNTAIISHIKSLLASLFNIYFLNYTLYHFLYQPTSCKNHESKNLHIVYINGTLFRHDIFSKSPEHRRSVCRFLQTLPVLHFCIYFAEYLTLRKFQTNFYYFSLP